MRRVSPDELGSSPWASMDCRLDCRGPAVEICSLRCGHYGASSSSRLPNFWELSAELSAAFCQVLCSHFSRVFVVPGNDQGITFTSRDLDLVPEAACQRLGSQLPNVWYVAAEVLAADCWN